MEASAGSNSTGTNPTTVPNNTLGNDIEARYQNVPVIAPGSGIGGSGAEGGVRGPTPQELSQPQSPHFRINNFGPTRHDDNSVGNTTSTPLCDGSEFTAGNFGIYASIALLVLVMVGSVLMLVYGPLITMKEWTTSCPKGFESACKSVGGVYRFSFALSCVFFVQLLGTAIYTKFFDYLWVPKYLLFAGTFAGFFFVKAEIFDLNGFAWFARIAAFVYLISQQIILLDFAYTLNEQWVKWSEEEETEENARVWLVGLICISVFLFSGSLAVIGIMFWQFQGCPDSTAIISLTIVFCTIATAFQLFFSDEGSLLTSAVMTTYATYICYSAVILNPNTTCNPTLSSGYQTVSKAVGIGILILSLAWSTKTTVHKIKEGRGVDTDTPLQSAQLALNPAILSDEAGTGSRTVDNAPGDGHDPYAVPGLKQVLCEASIIFILVSCYFAMVLTNWATVQSAQLGMSSINSGVAAMWLQAAAQWVALLFYLWSLVAPKLFPDRDFGVRRQHETRM